jgi:hypothetical protein
VAAVGADFLDRERSSNESKVGWDFADVFEGDRAVFELWQEFVEVVGIGRMGEDFAAPDDQIVVKVGVGDEQPFVVVLLLHLL